MKRLLTVVSLVIVMFGMAGPMVQTVQAQDVTIVVTSLVMPPSQDCSVQLSMDPVGPYTLGTWVQLHVWGNCGTVKFIITNQSTGQSWDKAETGSTEAWETWKTEETGSGTFEVCGLGRGDGGWENAARACRVEYVEGGQAPPPGSNPGDNVRCWINAFTVTPSSGPVGFTFNFAGQGQCDGNLRAVRFSIDGNPYGEHGGNTTNATWNSEGQSTGNHRICFHATAGDWSQAATSCTNINLTSEGTQPTHDTTQGQQTTNDQPGQTEDSNPSMVDNPGGDPPANDSNSSNGSSNAGTCRSYSGNITAGQQLVVDVDYDAYLNVRTNSGTGSQIIDELHRGDVVTAIGNPVCSGGLYWIEVGNNGHSGWVAIAGRDGQYLIVNGQPMTSNSSNQNNSSNDAVQDLSGWEGMNTPTNEQPDMSAWEGMNTQVEDEPDMSAWEDTVTYTDPEAPNEETDMSAWEDSVERMPVSEEPDPIGPWPGDAETDYGAEDGTGFQITLSEEYRPVEQGSYEIENITLRFNFIGDHNIECQVYLTLSVVDKDGNQLIFEPVSVSHGTFSSATPEINLNPYIIVPYGTIVRGSARVNCVGSVSSLLAGDEDEDTPWWFYNGDDGFTELNQDLTLSIPKTLSGGDSW